MNIEILHQPDSAIARVTLEEDNPLFDGSFGNSHSLSFSHISIISYPLIVRLAALNEPNHIPGLTIFARKSAEYGLIAILFI